MSKSLLLSSRISALLRSMNHPRQRILVRILAGKTSVSSSGFPYVSEASFRIFLEEIPHLFRDGDLLLEWLLGAEKNLERHARSFTEVELESIRRALRVIRQIVYSATICAPPDLWILKHVLSVHTETGLLSLLGQDHEWFRPEELAGRLTVNEEHLRWDLSLLHSRGLLRFRNGRYSAAIHSQAKRILKDSESIPAEFLCDMTRSIADVISGSSSESAHKLVLRFLRYERQGGRRRGWVCTPDEIEIGYRLVPLVLAIQTLKLAKKATPKMPLRELLPYAPNEVKILLADAGMVRKGKLTDLAFRVLDRGPGPFGIIHAYVPYMEVLLARLTGQGVKTRVNRLKNIAASQKANRKTFQMANDGLDRFCKECDFHYTVFLEHALGQGEATRQRLQRDGEGRIRYFGADLEDAAILRAVSLQEKGLLPANMVFIPGADIANPKIVIDAIRSNGLSSEGAVMMVGNGFHEIRGQTNRRVIQIFREYSEAGMLLIFTEESALNDTDLLATAWNTYHAGFRYVHELSGQGLRPAMGTDTIGRHSWKICAALGGYAVLSRYSAHTRTIFPYPRKGGHNPPISMTYFCVPARLARAMGFYPSHWSAV